MLSDSTPTYGEERVMEPSWKDAPDAPGLWLSTEGEQSVTEWICLQVDRQDWYRDGSRYYGPIPLDPQQEQP